MTESLNDAELEALCDAFVASNRAEFLDTDFDLPIQHAIERLVIERMRLAWHVGYGAGSSDATDGWLRPGAPCRSNPYLLDRVHNHAPWQPMCNERMTPDGLRGACLNDNGTTADR